MKWQFYRKCPSQGQIYKLQGPIKYKGPIRATAHCVCNIYQLPCLAPSTLSNCPMGNTRKGYFSKFSSSAIRWSSSWQAPQYWTMPGRLCTYRAKPTRHSSIVWMGKQRHFNGLPVVSLLMTSAPAHHPNMCIGICLSGTAQYCGWDLRYLRTFKATIGN